MDKKPPEVQVLDDPEDIAAFLADMINRLERGEHFKATIRVQHLDGSIQVVDVGYESEEEKDAALAKILKVLGNLH